MTSTRNKFLLALVALVLLATYAAAVKGDCTVENCATCLEEDATKCAECKPGYKLREPAMRGVQTWLQADRRRHLRGDLLRCPELRDVP
nr:unnamed protein product [Leishmania braziliensis]